MPRPVVKCIVDECTHYMDGDQCMAAKVSIYNEGEHSKAGEGKETKCQSFHHRETMGDIVEAFHNSNVSGSLSAAVMDGVQVTPDVECFVNNCAYWHSSNLCNAAQIDVVGANASQTADTDCSTFKEQ